MGLPDGIRRETLGSDWSDGSGTIEAVTPERQSGFQAIWRVDAREARKMEAYTQRLATWASDATDLLFPPECLLCQRSLLVEPKKAVAFQPFLLRDFCPACLAELLADLPRCNRCGASATLDGNAECLDCQQAPPLWRGLIVLSAYGDLTRDAVLRAKRPAGEPIAMAIGRRLALLVQTRLPSVRLQRVVPVPMHWRRRVVRGTSAADVMASAVARFLGIPKGRQLRRIRATSMQNTLPPRQRMANVAGVFQARGDIRDLNILLVDDVITTGATLTACTQTLLAAGARAVYVAAVAKAERTRIAAADNS